MLNNDLRARIESATVTVTGKVGRGVLVSGNLVLTVAHCVEYNCDYPMRDDFHFENVNTRLGTFRLEPYAVEPCQDVAVLGEPDNQQPSFQADVKLFESFCDQTEPLRLCLNNFELFQRFPVYVLTHEGKWIEGNAQQCAYDAPVLWVEFDDLVKGGTSGSPIVNESGEIVALVSIAGNHQIDSEEVKDWQPEMGFVEKGCNGPSPRPHRSLPVWIVERIQANVS